MDEIVFALVGTSFRSKAAQLLATALSPRDHISLEAEPDNPYDKNAIKILGPMGVHIGYVNKEACLDVLELLQNSPHYTCRVRAKLSPMSAICELIPTTAPND